MNKGNKEPIIYPAEQPLRVFISSVMDKEMGPWRKEAHMALSDAKYMWPWTFEYTPASAEATDENYLRHVREADSVLWLVGSKTTQPVINEIREALANNRRLIVLRMKAAAPDKPTNDLISEIGLRAKYFKTSFEDLRSTIALSFGDETARAWRSASPSASRPVLLDTLGKESRARAMVRWQAAGLSKSEAIGLADDMSVGFPSDTILPTIDRPLVVIVGEMGSGKSLTAERMMQQAIAKSITDRDAPVPIWLEASVVGDADLYGVIQKKANGLGDLQRQGAFVVINGADEAGAGTANNLLESARLVTNTWPNIYIVITSRPILNRLQKEEVSILGPLAEDDSLALVRKIAHKEVKGYDWPPSIKDAIKRPFWAIILGIRLRDNDSRQLPQSKGELLRFLISGSLPEKSEEVQFILRKLATLSTDRRDNPVPIAELDLGSNLDDLLKTGLVVKNERMLSFSTAILTQWFAAESLMREEVNVSELTGDVERLDLWRYAFIIALGEVDWNGSCRLIEILAEKDVGFTSEILDESLREYAMPGEPVSSPPAKELGGHIRQALVALLKGVGPLAGLMSISREDGRPHQFGVRSDGEGLLVLWRPQNDLANDVEDIPYDVHAFHKSDWGHAHWNRPTTDPAWAWKWAHSELSGELKRLVEKRRFMLEAGPIHDECVWVEAHAVMGVGSLHPGPFKLEDIEQRLNRMTPNAALLNDGKILDLKLLRQHTLRMKKLGLVELASPWPEPDRDFSGGLISNLYTDERQLERTIAVYENAIQAYTEIVDRYFPSMKYRFQTYVTFPAILKGYLQPGPRPVLSWHFEPLSNGVNKVDIRIRDEKLDHASLREDLEKNYQLIRQLRPNAQQWISSTHHQASLMDVFHISPVTELVYEWLRDDLKRIGFYD
ncbi:MAG: hypothetical protein AAB423_02170 [Patescibacteria group bacterium]